jgi:hypothetical protein
MKILQAVHSPVLAQGTEGGWLHLSVLCLRKVRPIYVAAASLESLGSLSTGTFFFSCTASLYGVVALLTLGICSWNAYFRSVCSCDAGTWRRNNDDTIGAWYVLLVSFIVSPSVAVQRIEGLLPPGHLVTVVVLRGPNKWELYFNDVVAWTFSCIISVRCLGCPKAYVLAYFSSARNSVGCGVETY